MERFGRGRQTGTSEDVKTPGHLEWNVYIHALHLVEQQETEEGNKKISSSQLPSASSTDLFLLVS